MTKQTDLLWGQREAQFGHLPGSILRDMARNEATPYAMRKEAVRIMLAKGYREAGHPELEKFVSEIRAEQEANDEVTSIVESAIEGPLPEAHNLPHVILDAKLPDSGGFDEKNAGPFRASVTTKTLMQDDIASAAPQSFPLVDKRED